MRRPATRIALVAVFALTVVATLSGPAGAQETDPSQELAISAVFPEGPPDDATVVDADTLSFEQGDVMLQVGITAFGDCPDFWVCLWADSNYSGQMIQFKDPTTTWHNLSDYGFNDQMSSWRNHKNKDAKWTWDSGGGGTERCMQANSSSSFVGSGDNDEASSIRIFGSDTAC